MIPRQYKLYQYILSFLWLSVLLLLTNAKLYANDFNDTIKKYRKSIVKVSTLSANGTGFFVGKEGHIVTSLHLIKDADLLQVTAETGETYSAERVGLYPEAGISIIKINKIQNIATVDLGNSSELRIGDWLMCAGYYPRRGLMATAGVADVIKQKFIQTDLAAPIEFDGAPIFDINGKVVGVISSGILNEDGIRLGIAVPINLVKPILDNNQIILHEYTQDYFPDLSLSDSKYSHDSHEEWFSKHLAAMEEPSLSSIKAKIDKECYRFTELPTFGPPVSVRVEIKGEQIDLYYTKLTGAGGYEPGEIAEREKTMLGRTLAGKLKKKINDIQFFNMIKGDGTIGVDGTMWIFEGVKDSRYHVIVRWSPQYHTEERNLRDFIGLCEYLLSYFEK